MRVAASSGAAIVTPATALLWFPQIRDKVFGVPIVTVAIIMFHSAMGGAREPARNWLIQPAPAMGESEGAYSQEG
jgi:hypothetical protein